MTIATRTYDLNVIATQIGWNGSIRTSAEYQRCKETLLEQTMSCNKKEAANWMVHIMKDCINRGNHGRDDDLRAEFLAAYDLHNHLSRA